MGTIRVSELSAMVSAMASPPTNNEPPPYTPRASQIARPSSIIRIPIRALELDLRDQDHLHVPNPLTSACDKKARYSKRSLNTPNPSIRFVPMTRAGLRRILDQRPKHARKGKGSEVAYLPHVVDPPGRRKAWIKQQLEQEAQWREMMLAQDPAAQARKNPKAFAKYTASHVAQVGFVAVTGPFGVGAILG